MPEYVLDVADKQKQEATVSLYELWESRTTSNEDTINSLKSHENSQAIHDKTCDEASCGCNSSPVALKPEHMQDGFLSRLLGIVKQKGRWTKKAASMKSRS